MPTPKRTQGMATDWTAEDLYNVLMTDIEPELVTTALPYVETLYAEETEEQKEERRERYARAFEEFERRFHAFIGLWKRELQSFKRAVLKPLRHAESQSEREKLEGIERSFTDE